MATQAFNQLGTDVFMPRSHLCTPSEPLCVNSMSRLEPSSNTRRPEVTGLRIVVCQAVCQLDPAAKAN